MANNIIKDLMGLSNESQAVELTGAIELTPAEAIEVGEALASNEATIADSFASYEMLQNTAEQMELLAPAISNEDEAVSSVAIDGIKAIAEVTGLQGVVEPSNESIEQFKVNAAKSVEVLLNKIAIAIKKWAEAAGKVILSTLNDVDKLVEKAEGIKGNEEIEITEALIKASDGIALRTTLWSADVEDKMNGAIENAIDKLTFSTNDFAEIVNGVTVSELGELVNADKKVKRGVISRLGNGKFGVLGWNVKGEDKSALVYFITTAAKVCKAKVGEGKFKDLDVDTKAIVDVLKGLNADAGKDLEMTSSKIEAVSKAAKAQIEAAGDDQKQVNQIKTNMINTTKYLSDRSIGKLQRFRNAVQILNAVKGK